MTKEFIPYDLALELKKLGFDEPCLRVGNPNGHTMWKWIEVDGDPPTVSIDDVVQVPYGEEWTQIPTYSQAFRFFREKYDWQYSIDPTADQHSHQLGYNYWIWNSKTREEQHTMPKNRPSGDWEYETYEEAELECLKKLIEIVKNGK